MSGRSYPVVSSSRLLPVFVQPQSMIIFPHYGELKSCIPIRVLHKGQATKHPGLLPSNRV